VSERDQVVAAWRRAPGECVLATVVQTTGSTYRRPGARMLLDESGWLTGGISGGCLEGDVLRRAFWATSREPALLVYDSSPDDDGHGGFGLGCHGTTTVLLERVGPDDPGLAFLERCARQRRRGVMATVIEGEGLGQRVLLDGDGESSGIADPLLAGAALAEARAALRSGRSSWGARLFVEVVEPTRSLVVFGGGFDVLPLVQLAALVGWQVTVVNARATRVTRACGALAQRVVVGAELPGDLPLGPTDAAVVMNHNFDRDREALAALWASAVGYLGVLGPRPRTLRLLEELGLSPDQRLASPIGLDLAAEGPQEIALSIVAEVQARLGGASARPLTALRGPLAEQRPLQMVAR
jgi:xanthine dehydrogenase accessory factor